MIESDGDTGAVSPASPEVSPVPGLPLQTPSQSAPQARTSQDIRRERWKATSPDKPLSKRERLFVAEYVKDMSASDAIKRMGRGGKHPSQRAYEYMQRPNVQKAIEVYVLEREQASRVTVEQLRNEYGKIAMMRATGDLLWSHKLQAMKELGSHLGMFKPEQQVTVPVQFVINGLGSPDIQSPDDHASSVPVMLIEKVAKGS